MDGLMGYTRPARAWARSAITAVIVTATAATLLCDGCLGRSTPRDGLMSYFPANEGFTWIYTGFAEYGHNLKPKTGAGWMPG